MGSNRSILLQKDEISEIATETGFTSKQIQRLYSRFTSLDKNDTGYLSKQDFERIPELHINPLKDRIIEVLIDDNGHDEKINFRQFAKVFSTFRRGKTDSISKENKLKFLFSVYDRDKDNKISKDELRMILNMLVGANLPEEQMNAIAERTIAELGADGNITFNQFVETLEKIDIDEKMSMKFLT
jgi:calcineurin B homologous protein 1